LDSLIFLLCSNRVAVPCDSRGHEFESPSITVRRTAWRKEQRRRSQSLRPRRRLRRSRLPSARRHLARNNATALRGIRFRSLRELRRSTGGIRGSQTAPPMTPKEFDGRRRRRDRGKHSGAGQTAGRNSGNAMFGAVPHRYRPLPRCGSAARASRRRPPFMSGVRVSLSGKR
jgi:hypothetical protein